MGLAAELVEAAALLRDGSAARALSMYGDYELYFRWDSGDVIDERISKRGLRAGANEFFGACQAFVDAAFEAAVMSIPSIASNTSFVAMHRHCVGGGQELATIVSTTVMASQ